MRARNTTLISFSIITLLVGFFLGAMVQKTIGIGNILRTMGIPYPTSVLPIELPSVVEVPEAYRGKMSLFILAGQSNMVGWAPLPEYQESNPRVFVFGNDFQWRIAREPVDDYVNQVDKISEDRVAAFGPSLAFALASLERNPDMVIGLIPCAKSSTAIIQWQRNLSDQSLYGSCLKRARAASPMGRISGILFFQGEEDALDPIQFPQSGPNSTTWALFFSNFIIDIRTDLNELDLPIVFAQLGSDPGPVDFPNWDIVKDQQQSIQLPRTAMITTDDLPLLDGLHFTTESYRIIGNRFADAYWGLMKEQNIK